jgi:branched-chain amino acid transport system ATP-binding protein
LGIVQVPEGRLLFPEMTVMENLEMGCFSLRARKDFKNSLEEVIRLFPILTERQQQLAGTLSGGEQQMLAIGRGLMARPTVLMLDEPSLGLAPLVVEEIIETIKTIRTRGTAILLVEQNVLHALSISDRAYILENGGVVMEGQGEELLKNEEVKKAYLGL